MNLGFCWFQYAKEDGRLNVCIKYKINLSKEDLKKTFNVLTQR